MESVVEHDDGLAAGERPGDFDGVLDRLGTRVDKEASFLVRARGEGVEALRQRDVALEPGHLEARVR